MTAHCSAPSGQYLVRQLVRFGTDSIVKTGDKLYTNVELFADYFKSVSWKYLYGLRTKKRLEITDRLADGSIRTTLAHGF
jgi:hypothetical protein